VGFVTDGTGVGSYPQRRFQIPSDGVELVLVRHGQSQAYRDGETFPLVDGHGDPPLSPHGRVQATLVCARLAAEGVDAIYVTTLRRTTETAAPLSERCGTPMRVEPSLREVYLGEWEGGLYRKMVADGHPLAQRVFAQERWDVIPGGEGPESFADRVRSGLAKIVAAHPGERVAVFTHGGVIGQAISLASGSRTFAFTSADNASISRIAVFGDRWLVRCFNDASHLDDPASSAG
jgi:probable phosphoglycerate mutase